MTQLFANYPGKFSSAKRERHLEAEAGRDVVATLYALPIADVVVLDVLARPADICELVDDPRDN